LEELKVKEDMPILDDYLKKEHKEKIWRTTIVLLKAYLIGNAFDKFYKFKGGCNQTPELKDVVTKKKQIHDKVYYR
jgi:hypothetical protein